MRRSLAHWSGKLPRPFEDFAREMDELMERFFGREGGSWSETASFNPLTNVAETDTQYEVTIDLPGIEPEQVSVELQEGHLSISGERKEETEEKEKTYHRVERRYGQFRRSVPLPGGVDQERIEAQYKDGVLKIILPKTEAERPRKIQVKS